MLPSLRCNTRCYPVCRVDQFNVNPLQDEGGHITFLTLQEKCVKVSQHYDLNISHLRTYNLRLKQTFSAMKKFCRQIRASHRCRTFRMRDCLHLFWLCWPCFSQLPTRSLDYSAHTFGGCGVVCGQGLCEYLLRFFALEVKFRRSWTVCIRLAQCTTRGSLLRGPPGDLKTFYGSNIIMCKPVVNVNSNCNDVCLQVSS